MGPNRPTLVVVGNGMVGHKLVESLCERGGLDHWRVVVFGEERRRAYDRVALTSFLTGASADDLDLARPAGYANVEVHLGDPVVGLDRCRREVRAASGRTVTYDALVLATGSVPFVPPVPGAGLPGVFVYRTIDDLEALRTYASGRRRGAVVGGGLLGLEAASALRHLGLATAVVEFAPRLMPLQVDEAGGAVLRARIEALGVEVHTSTQTSELVAGADGAVAAMRFADGEMLATDLVVFSAGIRPRDDVARAAGLALGERGGVVVDDGCRTSDERIYAIGECAVAHGRTWGLVAPGYEMARVVAGRLLGGDDRFSPSDLSTKLKCLGVDVASFGDAFAVTPGAESVTVTDPVNGVYKRLVVGPGGGVLGGILVGDATAYTALLSMARGDMPVPADPAALVLTATGAGDGVGVAALAETATICSCNHVAKGAICTAVAAGAGDLGAVKAATGAGTGCGGCLPLVSALLRDELGRAGVEVRDDLCEHFPLSRPALFEHMRVDRIASFGEALARYGSGRGCEVCKPTVASILASLGAGYVLQPEQASLQDTNDHFLANLQRDGSYSVVPRLPGGEVTPAQLIAIGEVARDFGLYTKITGGQRIDLFGARVDDLPAIWERLIAAGMESGHAYGKALRTVKSCVGATWCRYGVQDSTSLAVALELRYRGLRAPHKIKAAVSGCARECAEAQSKDVGVIATERGWNLFVGGNGGMRPEHAVLLVEDVDTATLVRLVDRFLMYYVRTAERLERTAPWLRRVGVDHVRAVVVDDVLGIAAELEADLQRHVDGYRCEWAETLGDPIARSRFRTFVNADGSDPNIVFVPERGQHRPARDHEKALEVTR